MAAAGKALLSVLDYLDVDGFAGLTALLCRPGFGALAEAVPTKARGTRQFVGRHKGSPAPFEKDDAKLPLLNAGSMRPLLKLKLLRPPRSRSYRFVV